MTSGVMRPFTLQDILGALNGQASGSGTVATTISGLGYVAETDETSTSTDTATALLVSSAPAWDQSQWGTLAWS